MSMIEDVKNASLYRMIEERMSRYESNPKQRTHTREKVMKEFNISEDDIKDAEDVELE